MKNEDIMKTAQFEKATPTGISCCQVQLFDDGSVYVLGDQIEAIFENSATAWQTATEYLSIRGYKEVLDGRPRNPQ